MPRLLRDAQVLPIWEGTTNIQSLDLLRVLSKEGFGPFLKRISKAVETAAKGKLPKENLETLKERIEIFSREISSFASESPEKKERLSRPLLEKCTRIFVMSLLAEASEHPPLQDVCQAALRRLLNRRSLISPLGLLTDSASIADEGLLLECLFKKPATAS
jgi:hypothetical protein